MAGEKKVGKLMIEMQYQLKELAKGQKEVEASLKKIEKGSGDAEKGLIKLENQSKNTGGAFAKLGNLASLAAKGFVAFFAFDKVIVENYARKFRAGNLLILFKHGVVFFNKLSNVR